MTKISVVIPCRDRDKLIGGAIESLLKQTEQDIEIIIVDDHSKNEDKTAEVIKKIADGRIKYFKLEDQNGKGIAAARNFGNMMAQSDYIATMDSDDICYPI
jgi:glycosyltransferase involved in cell wall biosynthesis